MIDNVTEEDECGIELQEVDLSAFVKVEQHDEVSIEIIPDRPKVKSRSPFRNSRFVSSLPTIPEHDA